MIEPGETNGRFAYHKKSLSRISKTKETESQFLSDDGLKELTRSI